MERKYQQGRQVHALRSQQVYTLTDKIVTRVLSGNIWKQIKSNYNSCKYNIIITYYRAMWLSCK